MNLLEIIGSATVWVIATYVIGLLIILTPQFLFRKRQLEAAIISYWIAAVFAAISVVIGLVSLGRSLA